MGRHFELYVQSGLFPLSWWTSYPANSSGASARTRLYYPEIQALDHRPASELIDLGHQRLRHPQERPLPFVAGHADLLSAVSEA